MISDPSLIAIYFYKLNTIMGNHDLFNYIIENNMLTILKEENDHKIYSNVDNSLWVEWLLYHDIEAVRVAVHKKGFHSAAIWAELRELPINKIIYANKEKDTFLGASIIYMGLIDQLDENIQSLVIESGLQNIPIKLANKIEYGWFWQIGELKENTIEYAFLLPSSMKNRANEEFILAANSGIIKIESHLHKGFNQVKYYEDARDKLIKLGKELDEEQLKLVKSIDNPDFSEHKERLDAVSKKYANFVEIISWANTIQNTIQINLEDYKGRWSQVQGNDNMISNFNQKKFEKTLGQMRWDFNYFSSILNTVRTSLEVIRSMNLTSIQKEGLSLQMAAGVVESVLIFYYSLGIWHSLIEEEKWKLITSLDKAIVGFILAITLSLASHFFFTKKNRNFYRICVVVAIASLIYATMVTYRA